jgi:hypothetical protein
MPGGFASNTAVPPVANAADPLQSQPDSAAQNAANLGVPMASQSSAFPTALPGHITPLVLHMAYSKFSLAQAYGRGPTTLVYAHSKRATVMLAGLLGLTAAIVATTLCLYRGFCSADDLNGRATYSASASNAVVPVCLVLLLIVAPLSSLAAHLGRPGVNAAAAVVEVRSSPADRF